MAADRAEAMLVLGALEAAEVKRPTGRDTDQGGAKTNGSISGCGSTDDAGVVTEAGTTTATPLQGCRAYCSTIRGRGLNGRVGQRTCQRPGWQAEPGQGVPNQALWACVKKAQAAQDAPEKARKWA